MTTHPTAGELIRAVTQWIESVRSQLDGRDAFLARVAVHALEIVDRERMQATVVDSESKVHMAALLGHSGDLETLNRELCERLRNGELDVGSTGLLHALRADTLARLSVDQPTYRHEALDALTLSSS